MAERLVHSLLFTIIIRVSAERSHTLQFSQECDVLLVNGLVCAVEFMDERLVFGLFYMLNPVSSVVVEPQMRFSLLSDFFKLFPVKIVGAKQ
jgi:hypothetical protein